MDLKEIMMFQNFCLLGDTLNEGKYAFKIKHELINNGYNVCCVGKELLSINDCDFDIDVINLCINPIKGLILLKECRKQYKVVLIQPNAESPDIMQFLNDNNISYLEGCSLVGMRLYKKNSDI